MTNISKVMIFIGTVCYRGFFLILVKSLFKVWVRFYWNEA